MPKCDIRTIKKKIKEKWWHWLFKYEQIYYRRNRRDRADYLAQKYAKLKVYVWKKKVKCLTCDMVGTIDQMNGCHWLEKRRDWNYWCRWEERNIYCCCEQCNCWEKERHHNRLTVHVMKLYWQERVEGKMAETRKLHPKPQWYEIDEVIEHYTQKIKKLHNDLK